MTLLGSLWWLSSWRAARKNALMCIWWCIVSGIPFTFAARKGRAEYFPWQNLKLQRIKNYSYPLIAHQALNIFFSFCNLHILLLKLSYSHEYFVKVFQQVHFKKKSWHPYGGNKTEWKLKQPVKRKFTVSKKNGKQKSWIHFEVFFIFSQNESSIVEKSFRALHNKKKIISTRVNKKNSTLFLLYSSLSMALLSSQRTLQKT